MSEKTNSSNMLYFSIIAIVAIVAIVFMMSGKGPQANSQQPIYVVSEEGNFVGQAAGGQQSHLDCILSCDLGSCLSNGGGYSFCLEQYNSCIDRCDRIPIQKIEPIAPMGNG